MAYEKYHNCKNCHCCLARNVNTGRSISSKLEPVYHLSWQCLSQGNVVICFGEMLFLVLLLDAYEEIELMRAFCVDKYKLCLAILTGNANQNQYIFYIQRQQENATAI